MEYSGFSRQYVQSLPLPTIPREGRRRSSKVSEGLRRLSKIVKGFRELSKVVEGRQRLSKVVEGFQALSKVVEGRRRSSKVFERCRRLTKVDEGFRELSKVVVGRRRSSKVVGGFRELSKVVVGRCKSSKVVEGHRRLSKVVEGYLHQMYPRLAIGVFVSQLLAIGWTDGQVSTWSVMEPLQENASPCTSSNQGIHRQSVTVLLWNPSGTRLVTGDKVNLLKARFSSSVSTTIPPTLPKRPITSTSAFTSRLTTRDVSLWIL